MMSSLPPSPLPKNEESLSYLRIRCTLILALMPLANQLKTRDAWTLLLNHHLDTCSLCGGEHIGVETSTPFLMLRLNRDGDDDDAYCFCRHALQLDWTDSRPDQRVRFGRGAGSSLNYCFRDVMEDFR